MSVKNNSSEKGQVLVLVVLGMVVLLGFTALAVDGSMIYADRRWEQNASDASSLAGASEAALTMENYYQTYQNWDCGSVEIYNTIAASNQIAISRASKNDFTIDTTILDNNGVNTNCRIFDNGSYLDKYLEVRTLITQDTKTAFAHFVFNGPLRNTVDSTARVRPRSPLAYGNAIVALRQDCPNTNTGGVHFDGTADLSVTGGGIFSNACMKATGSVNVDVYGGYNITCIGDDCLTTNGGPSLDAHDGGQLAEGTKALPPESYAIPAPDCSLVPNRGSQSGGGTISPGRYSGITLHGSSDYLEMEPGLYCLSGDFKATGGTIVGNGVTIYITSGDFDVAGGVQIQLSAPPARNCSYCPSAVAGVLIYLAAGNSGEVALLGTSDSEYLGVVYAPSGMIEAGGTGSELSEIHAQLIADTVKLHGTTQVVINFNGEDNYQIPAQIELSK